MQRASIALCSRTAVMCLQFVPGAEHTDSVTERAEEPVQLAKTDGPKQGDAAECSSISPRVSALFSNRNCRVEASGYLTAYAGGFWVSKGPGDAFIGISGHVVLIYLRDKQVRQISSWHFLLFVSQHGPPSQPRTTSRDLPRGGQSAGIALWILEMGIQAVGGH